MAAQPPPFQALFDAVRGAKASDGRLLSKLFAVLPSKTAYPDYYLVIHQPISLKEIKAKIEKGQYAALSELRADLELMLSNCKTYNEEGSDIYDDAISLGTILNDTYVHLSGESGPKSPSSRPSRKRGRDTNPSTAEPTPTSPTSAASAVPATQAGKTPSRGGGRGRKSTRGAAGAAAAASMRDEAPSTEPTTTSNESLPPQPPLAQTPADSPAHADPSQQQPERLIARIRTGRRSTAGAPGPSSASADDQVSPASATPNPPRKRAKHTNESTVAGLGSSDKISTADLRDFGLAIEHGDQRAIEVLFKRNQPHLTPNTLVPAPADTFDGAKFTWNSVHMAAFHGQNALLTWLVSRGGQVDSRDTWYQGAALAWAAFAGHVETCRLLVHQLKADRNQKNSAGQVAMDVVSDPDNPAWVGVLVDPPPMPAQQSQQPLQQPMPTADTPARKGRGRKSTTTAATPASAATALAGLPTTAPTVAASSTDAAATSAPIPAPNGQTPAPITIPTAPNGQPMPSPAHPRSAGTITPPQLTPTGQLTDHQIMLNLLNRIAQAKDQSGRSMAEVFHTLPSAKEYPDYYEAIPRPVSLTEIHSRLQNAVTAANNPTTAANNPLAAYTVPEFRNDVIRMFANAMYYNEESSQIYMDAAQLLEAFKQEAANAFKERIVAITDSTLVAGQVTGPGRFLQGKDGQIVLIERIGKTLRGADMIEGTIFMTHDGFPRAESFLPGEVYRYERFEFASAYFVRQCHVMFARDFSQGFPSGFNINNVYVCEQQLTTRSLVPIQSWTAGLNTPPVAVNLLSHGFNLQLTRFESPTSLQAFSTMVREGKLPQSAAPQNQQQSGPSSPAPTPRRRGRPRKSETMAAEAAANAVGAFVTPSPGAPAATPAAKMGRKSRTATNVTQVMQTPTVPMPVQPVRPGLMMPPSVAAPVGVVQQGQKPMQMAVQYGQQGPQQQQQQQHYQQQGPQQPQLAMRPPQIQYQQASHQYPQSPVMPTMTAGQQQQMPGQLLTQQQLQQQQQAYYFQQQQQQLAYLQQQQQQRPGPIVTPSANTMPGYAPQAQGTGLGQTQSQQVVAHAVSAGPPSSAAVATPVSATSSSRSEKNKPRLIPFIRIEVPGRTMLLEFTPQVPNQSIHVPSSATCIKILPIAVSPTLLPLPAAGSSPTTTATGEANGINGASGTITQAAGPIMGTIPFGIAVMRGGKVLNPRYGPDVPLKTSLQEYLLRDDVAAAHGLDPARYFAGPVIETDLTEGVTMFEVWATAQPAGAAKEMQASQLHVVRV